MDIGSIEQGKIEIKVLTTNEVSITILPKEHLKEKVIYPGAAANRALGEHGLAMSIKVRDGEKSKLILLDTGGLGGTILENSKQLGVNINEVDTLILSHGHFDHFGSLTTVIPELREGCEFYLNPKCYEQLYVAMPKPGIEIPLEEMPTAVRKQKDNFILNNKMPSLSKNMIEKMAQENGVKIIETSNPEKLVEGLITSGEIDITHEDEYTKGFYVVKSRKEFETHTFRDETSIYINVKDKGLVIITGCGHCGIMNTIKHAQKITGIDKIYAVIGGFHEEWNPIELIEKKVQYLISLNPEIVCGMHCTGFEFNKIMAQHDSHVLGVVGTEFHL